MSNPNHNPSLSSAMLGQEALLAGERYAEYRTALAAKLDQAERREHTTYWVCIVTGVTSFTLMFVGGSRLFGSFDPWDAGATPLSLALGTIYVVSTVVFWLGLAAYFSRFRPTTRRIAEQMRDAKLDAVERQLAALRDAVVALQAGPPPRDPK